MKTIYLVGCVKRDISRWVVRYTTEGPVDLSKWYCGITHVENTSKLDSYLEKKGSQNLYFKRWLANDPIASQEILSFFIKNGMINRPIKGKLNVQTRYVYVFKIQPAVVDDIIELLS